MNERRTVLACLMAALLSTPAPALAQDSALPADASRLVCDLGIVVDCTPEGECTSGSPESVDLPRFLRLDLAEQQMSSPSPGFEGESTPIAFLGRSEGQILMAGSGRAGRSFAMRIDTASGALQGTVLADDFSLLAFGGCFAEQD